MLPCTFQDKFKRIDKVLKRAPLTVGAFCNLDCANVLDGKKVLRVISWQSFLSIIGVSSHTKGSLMLFVRFLMQPGIHSSLSARIIDKISNGYLIKEDVGEARFVDARVITDFCRLILSLRRVGKLAGRYLEYATNCERFMLGLADVGLVALIDEATGYDKVKRRNEYREIFNNFIRAEHSEWVKEFSDSFFDSIYKVYRLEKTGKNHPSFFGGLINRYIYYPLANSHGAILEKLQEKDPVVNCGGRRYRLHQFLTDEIGKPTLRKHINQVEALLLISSDKAAFRRNFKKLFPQPKDQMEFDFGDDI